MWYVSYKQNNALIVIMTNDEIVDTVPRSLVEAFNTDERPIKRRKVTKSGPYSLSRENGLTEKGIPLGYVPLARITLRMVSMSDIRRLHIITHRRPPCL